MENRYYKPGTPDDAESRLRVCLIAGIVLCVAGGVLIGTQWPHTEAATDCGMFGSSCEPEDVGSWGVVALGIAGATVGNWLVLLGIIGYGVMLGRRAAGPLPSPADR